MTYRACVIEDNKDESDSLCRNLSEYGKTRGYDFAVTRYADALEFFDRFVNDFDFIFLDIELPHMDGMEAARRIREKDGDVIIVFVTNMAQYAVKGYAVGAFDFIVKPVRYESFVMTMDRAVGRYASVGSKEIWITDRNSKRRLRVSDIKYVEVAHHCCIYHTVDGDFTTYEQLYSVCENLADSSFALCNRCFLVNLKYVTAIEDFSVTVGGEKLQISRNKKKSFLMSLNEYLGGK